MLTCKTIARTVVASNAAVSIPKGIAHGLEYEAIEYHNEVLECGFYHDEDDSDSGDGDCDCVVRGMDLEKAMADRTQRKHVLEFFERLDNGWNRSKSRFCTDCGLFRSTKQAYWDKKAQSFEHKQYGRLAQYWMIGNSEFVPNRITHCKDANEYAKRWIARAAGAAICPLCKVNEWSYKCMNCDLDI